jgi:HEAT repeat protein
MGLFKNITLLASIGAAAACHSLDKQHVLYLMQSQETNGVISLYEAYKNDLGHHDFEVLVHMATAILEQGIRSPDENAQLSSLYGIGMASMNSSLDILEHGIKSQSFETQLVSIQLLAHMHDDRADELLTKAMASPFLMARMEAGFHLAQTKHRKASGHIEALMYKIPQEFWFYFPQFFALIGTSDAIEVLKKLMEDPMPMTRVESILCAARFGRDDLLPKIRAHLTHLHADEQEACAYALGLLKDSKSIPQLKKLALSSSIPVKLASLRALYALGDTQSLLPIFDLAHQSDPLAIALLGELPGGEDVLASQLKHNNIHVRFNAAYSLLLRRDNRCLPALEEFLLRDSKDLGFQPQTSIGRSLMAWKVVPSLGQQGKNLPFDLAALSLQLREQMLSACLELPESDFLQLAEKIFRQREIDLVPLLVNLLENHHTEATIHLLKKHAEHAGAPLIRTYCNLALYRLKEKGPYEDRLRQWIHRVQGQEMVRFRPSLPWNQRKEGASYELTPEENTRLLLEAYQALSDRHDEKGIEIILQGIKQGHPKNRYALAGLLIYTLQ